MKKITALLLSSLLITGLFAQPLTLKSVCQGLAQTPNTTGDFTQIKTLNATGRQLKSSGKFIIAREGIMWQTLKPFPSSLIVTNDKMIQIAGDGTKSVLSGSDNQIFKNISGTLSSVFSGNTSELEKNFNVEFKLADTSSWIVILTPKDSTIGSVMKNLKLEGVSTDSNVVLNSMEMAEASNNKIRYEFSNQKYPKELTADEKALFTAE